MKTLSENALERITGGFSTWAAIGVAAVVVFIVGVVDGQIKLK